jgi:hexosaminidase
MNKLVSTFYWALFLSVMALKSAFAQHDLENKYSLIPQPQKVVFGSNELNYKSINVLQNDFLELKPQLEFLLKGTEIPASNEGLIIRVIKDLSNTANNEEAYQLEIDQEVNIKAKNANGAFYALQTLKQLIVLGESNSLPKLHISDNPAFKVRGFMHDTGRNFQSVEQLKEQIEVLAQYKYNTFHWHLTDDPAWRLESKIYPELQSDKATSRGQGDFYSHEDFLEIIQFCKERFITVIPEFDIPGHSGSFRKAFGFKSMKDSNVKPILLKLFEELCNLADAKTMPYIHIGTDEVRNKSEEIDGEVILEIMELLKKKGRAVIVWDKGLTIPEDTSSISQLWAMHEARERHRFIDSRANYINHLDPFVGMVRLFFQQPCRQATGDELALGGILCAWPDNRVAQERDIIIQNPIYPAMVFYSESIWHGKEKNNFEYWAKYPPQHTPEFRDFASFELKVVKHRDSFFQNKEFPYVLQSKMNWRLLGPLDHQDKFDTTFPIEESIQEFYTIGDSIYTWSDKVAGGTVHLKHFFGFPSHTSVTKGTYYAFTRIYAPAERTQDFWLGFQGWSRSGGRRGGPTPGLGEWHYTKPAIWVNGDKISPPQWQQENFAEKSDEIPFVDEDYFYRKPTEIKLKKGWNEVLLKIPHGGNSWKWMFTCTPVQVDGINVKEVSDLIFEPSINEYSSHYYKLKAIYENTPDTYGEVIMLGNSITEGGKWEDLFPEINIVNRGISGDVTYGILHRMEELTSSQPKKVFLMVGTNDLALGKSLEYVVASTKEIIEKIQMQSPETSIYLQTILPVNPNVGNKFLGHKGNGEKIIQVNDELKNLANSHGLTLLDLHLAFSDKNGNLIRNFTHDGLHLSEEGYQHWKKQISQYLK